MTLSAFGMRLHAATTADGRDRKQLERHDSFSGRVYADLSTLEIVSFDPFTGEVASFDTMPVRGRVAVSPGGGLYFAPIKYLDPGLLIRYPLPDTF